LEISIRGVDECDDYYKKYEYRVAGDLFYPALVDDVERRASGLCS
jgi:hypothetical protein